MRPHESSTFKCRALLKKLVGPHPAPRALSFGWFGAPWIYSGLSKRFWLLCLLPLGVTAQRLLAIRLAVTFISRYLATQIYLVPFEVFEITPLPLVEFLFFPPHLKKKTARKPARMSGGRPESLVRRAGRASEIRV
jgi:hypothetical protein